MNETAAPATTEGTPADEPDNDPHVDPPLLPGEDYDVIGVPTPPYTEGARES